MQRSSTGPIHSRAPFVEQVLANPELLKVSSSGSRSSVSAGQIDLRNNASSFVGTWEMFSSWGCSGVSNRIERGRRRALEPSFERGWGLRAKLSHESMIWIDVFSAVGPAAIAGTSKARVQFPNQVVIDSLIRDRLASCSITKALADLRSTEFIDRRDDSVWKQRPGVIVGNTRFRSVGRPANRIPDAPV